MSHFGAHAVTEFEPYVQLREGHFDVCRIGAYTYLGGAGAVFRHIERIGRFCAIAGGIVAGQVEHGTDQLAVHPMFTGSWAGTWPHLARFYGTGEQLGRAARAEAAAIAGRSARIVIGHDVWIGYGAFIRRGVTLGDGAVVAARAVVVEDVPPYGIVAGVPARLVRYRFDAPTRERLLALRWWDKGLAALTGVDYTCPQAALEQLARNCAELPDWQPAVCRLYPDGTVRDAGGVLVSGDGDDEDDRNGPEATREGAEPRASGPGPGQVPDTPPDVPPLAPGPPAMPQALPPANEVAPGRRRWPRWPR